jgi:NodT family efflux transporter outer membrane factor (OMF) lipoprotein
VLGDTELDSLVTRAVAANLDLAAAAARVREARAARAVAAGGLWPELDASATAQRVHGAGAPAHDLFQAGLDAAWEVDLFGGGRRDVEAATADLQAAIEDRRAVLASLTSEVAVDYVALRGLQERLRVAAANLQTQQRTVDITRRKYEGGLTSRLDVVKAEAEVATTRAVIPSLHEAAQQAVYDLDLLLGAEPGSLADELATPAPIPAVPATVPVGLPSDLLRRRPDLRRDEAALHAATARIGVAEADLFPHFSLTAAFGYAGGSTAGLLGAAQRGWSLGSDLLLPLFAGGPPAGQRRAQQSGRRRSAGAVSRHGAGRAARRADCARSLRPRAGTARGPPGLGRRRPAGLRDGDAAVLGG